MIVPGVSLVHHLLLLSLLLRDFPLLLVFLAQWPPSALVVDLIAFFRQRRLRYHAGNISLNDNFTAWGPRTNFDTKAWPEARSTQGWSSLTHPDDVAFSLCGLMALTFCYLALDGVRSCTTR